MRLLVFLALLLSLDACQSPGRFQGSAQPVEAQRTGGRVHLAKASVIYGLLSPLAIDDRRGARPRSSMDCCPLLAPEPSA